jgi:hypothetical protein
LHVVVDGQGQSNAFLAISTQAVPEAMSTVETSA